MADTDREVEKIEQGNAWDETDEVVRLEVKKPLNKVIPIRLSADKWEQIREEARELGVGPTTLVRMWVLERLHQRSISHEDISRHVKLISGYRGFLPQLTTREKEILEYVARGCPNKQVAKELGINEGTVEIHLAEICRKLHSEHEDAAPHVAFLWKRTKALSPESGGERSKKRDS